MFTEGAYKPAEADAQHKSNAFAKISENLYYLSNEPSLACYRLQEHTGKTLPALVQNRIDMSKNKRKLDEKLVDLDYGIQSAKSISASAATFSNIEDLLKRVINMPVDSTVVTQESKK